MDCKKYIGMDVHQASISIAVRDAAGKVVAESIIETKAATILDVHPRNTGKFVDHLRRRNQRRLVVRSIETARHQSDRVRSAEERSAECGQQE